MVPDKTRVAAPVFISVPLPLILPLKVPVPEATLTVVVPVSAKTLVAVISLDKASVVEFYMFRVPLPSPLLEFKEIVPTESVVPPE